MIYEQMLLFQERQPLGLVGFTTFLQEGGLLDKIGGPGFLSEIYSFIPTPAHYPWLKAQLRNQWMLRRAINMMTEGIQACYAHHEQDVDALLDRIETAALAIRPPDSNITSDEFREALATTFDAIQLQMQHTGDLAGLSTGLSWLDQVTGGLMPGMYVIAARPSSGKTALALNIFSRIVVDQGLRAGFFSLETSKDRLVRRIIAAQGWIPLSALLSGKLDGELQRKFIRTYKDLMARVSAFIDDRSALTIAQVKAKARRWKRQHGIKALFLDYLQRMGTSAKNKNPRDVHAENSTGLADLSKELALPIVVLAQLNRDCETEKRRPRMSDVEGCGRIEQDADVMALISRHKKAPENQFDRHLVIHVDKNRDGPTGAETHLFRAAFQRFEPDPVNEDLLK